MSLRLGLPALGVATPLGRGKNIVAQALFAGDRSGLVTRDDLIPGKAVRVGVVPGSLPEIGEDLEAFDCRNNRLMLAALNEIEGAITAAVERFGRHRIAVVLGTSTSGVAESEVAYGEHRKTGAWPRAFEYSKLESGGLSEFAARHLRLTGPAYTVTTACSSSAKVFGSARRLISAGVCDAAVVGGADSLCRLTLNGFASLEALSSGMCNPFSVNRDGINIGEGAAAFLVTPDPAPVELLGIGETSDAYHVSAPDPDGAGAEAAMRAALDDAAIGADRVGYINLHGTATPLNDSMESRSVAAVFPEKIPCSSTKALTGHLLGAAGATEAAYLWLALHPGFNPGRLPPHIWDGEVDPELPALDLVAPGTPYSAGERGAMMSNSFAFGGNNASLILGSGDLAT